MSKTPAINFANCPVYMIGDMTSNPHNGNGYLLIFPQVIESMRAWLSLMPDVTIDSSSGSDVVYFYKHLHATELLAKYNIANHQLIVRKHWLYNLREKIMFPKYPQGDRRGKQTNT